MLLFIHLLLFLIFSILALLHFYWMLGYQGGLDKVVPTHPERETSIQPGFLACAIVALALSFVALFYLQNSSLTTFRIIPKSLSLAIGWGIPIVFFLRAIGEFNYVGLFKKIRGTSFAKADNQVFIPLCCLIGTLGVLVMI